MRIIKSGKISDEFSNSLKKVMNNFFLKKLKIKH